MPFDHVGPESGSIVGVRSEHLTRAFYLSTVWGLSRGCRILPYYPRGGGTDRRRSKTCLNYPLAGALIGPSTAHGQYTGYYSLPALDYAVFKAGLFKLMPAFAEEAAPLGYDQGTQAYDPLFSQQGKQMPPLAEGVCMH
jgi:hypothetical protein